MPNEFSVEIHNHLSQKILEVEKAVRIGDETAAAFAQGQLVELLWIRKYLQENIDLKNFVYY